jgi:peptidyl-prolyl cis-trans isomerase SurA
MMKIFEPVKAPIFGALLCALVFLGAEAAAQSELGIAAVVNDEVISLRDLNGRLSLVIATSRLEDRPEIRRRLAPQVLRNLIDEQLKLQEAKRQRIRVTQAEIDGAIIRIETNNDFGAGGLTAFLAGRGIEMPVLLSQLEAEIAWVKVVSRGGSQRISISDEEIDEKMAEIGANNEMPEFLASEIFLGLESPDQDRDLQLLADRLFQQLGSGANFDALARNFSHSGTAAVGGDLGWVQQGQIDEELYQVLAKLQKGHISAPVRTLSGYHLFFLRDRRAPGGPTEDEMIVSLNQLFVEVSEQPSAQEIETRMAFARTLGETAGNCQDMDGIAAELNSPLSGRLGRVKLGSLPLDLRDTVRTLPVNEASTPRRTEKGIVILMVCERQELAAGGLDRAQVEEMLIQRRMEVLAEQYLRDLRRAAFVDIRL